MKVDLQGDTGDLVPAENTLAWIATFDPLPTWQISLDSLIPS